MYYTIYRITNNLNHKTYIGKHQTHDLDDGYFGSGKHLKRAITKHGLENFTKEILHVFETEEEMNTKERELVTEEFCGWSNTYNICVGGQGGFGYVNKHGLNIYENHGIKSCENAHATMRKRRECPEYNKKYMEMVASNLEKALKQSMINNPNGTFFGKKHSGETKTKISVSAKVHQSGSGNSQFGSMWITNGIENKKLPKGSIIPDGWTKGRQLTHQR